MTDDPLLAPERAVLKAKKILRHRGYFSPDNDHRSPYYSKAGMMDRKIRVSDHPYDRTDVSVHRQDILVHVVFQDLVRLSYVQAEVDRACALFEEVRASREKSRQSQNSCGHSASTGR